jgi:protein-S-isoprenylcysteine O-methyltransferase Ste14
MLPSATELEFRQRSWIFMALFLAALSCYELDSTNAAVALAAALGGSGGDSGDARHGLRIVLCLATLLVVSAASLRTWANAYLNSKVVRSSALHTERLIADGPYRHTRNPLYLAMLLLGFGTSLAASRLGAVLLVSGLWIFLYRLIGREEAGLREAHGAQYAAFCAALPRFWPSVVPRVPPGGARPQWGQALRGEAWIWGFAALTAGFAWTQDHRLYFWGSPPCLLLHLWNRRVVNRSRRAEHPAPVTPPSP